MDENTVLENKKLNEIISDINRMIKNTSEIENKGKNNLQEKKVKFNKEFYDKNLPWAYQNL